MKIRKYLIALLALLLALNLTGCQRKPVNKYPDRDVTYSDQLPEFDGDSICIHYQRKDNLYDKWTLWLWVPNGTDDNVEDDFNGQDDFGVIACYPLSYFEGLDHELGIIIKIKGVWTKDGTDADRFIDFSTLKKDENNRYHVYLFGGDAGLYDNPKKQVSDQISIAQWASETSIYLAASTPVEAFTVYRDGEAIYSGNGAGRKKFTENIGIEAEFSASYSVAVTFRETGATLTKELSTVGLYSSEMFNELYYYDGELGALYTPQKTTFRVWSPVATSLELRLYENGTPISVNKEKGSDSFQTYAMTRKDKGVYEVTLEGDQAGKYYTYFVKNYKYPDGAEIVDPYARGCGVNGLRGMVVDFSKTNPENWDQVRYLKTDRTALTVYETHIVDLTSSSTWNGSPENQKKYLGFIETGTTYSEGDVTVTTGFDHLKELGVNALQLMPIFDQANDEVNPTFNWGYNPLNYNCLEGSYSSDPYDGYARIREFKQLVETCNEAQMRLIMDVVYNHVNGAEGSNFDVLMPNYYFRYNNGALSNGSGCGNETASENRMMRKFIIDSVIFWTKEYKLSGFRFDLMGLHDLETMKQVVEAARAVNPDIVIYGEPWSGGTSTLNDSVSAKQINGNAYQGYGAFNDQMRDGLIKGGLSGANEKGWVTESAPAAQADLNRIAAGINGAVLAPGLEIADPNKCVSYVTCHDNYTLYDRIKAAGINDEETVAKMAMLANSVVFTSKGTTFMLAGEEFLRSKGGNSNSYNASYETNELNYALKIANIEIFANYQNLLAFKQQTAGLHGNGEDISVEILNGGAALQYTVHNGAETYLIVHGNGLASNITLDTAGYEVWLDTLGLNSGRLDSLTLQPYQSVILRKK